jgi:hypothetical protein
MESREARLSFRIIGGEIHEHADPPHALRLLRARRQRPRCCSTAEQRDELAASIKKTNGHGALPSG